MTAPPLASILLASVDPNRLRSWYVEAFNPHVSIDGFMQFGGVAMLIDQRDDIAGHLAELGVSWLAPLEARDDGWFATLADPDGNIVQIIELSIVYLERQRHDTERRDG